MDWTVIIYAVMALLFGYSLIALLAMSGAAGELQRQGRQIAEWETAQAVRKAILEKDSESREAPIEFRNRALRSAMESYTTDVKRMSLKDYSKYQCDIEDYIHMDLLERLGNCAFVEHACSALTALGILGTFVGMIGGLTGFDPGDADKALASIAELTDGMEFAFVTSIVGIILSLTLGTIHRIIRRNAEENLDKFIDAFRENILCDQREAGYNQLLSQMGQVVSRLESRSEDEMLQLEMVAQKFISEIAKELGFESSALKEAMKQINAQQEIFAGAVKEFSNQITQLSGEIQAVKASFDGIVGQSATLAENMERAGTNIGIGMQKLREMVEADSEILENNRQLSEQMRQNAEELSEMIGSVGEQSVCTADVVRKLADYTASAVNETAAGCNNLVEKHYEDLKNRMKSLMDVAEAQTTHIHDVSMAQMEEIRKENQRSATEQTEKIMHENSLAIDQMRNATNEAVRSISENTRRIVLEMPQTMMLREELDSIVQNQRALVQHLNKRNSLFVKLIQTLRRDAE